MVILARLSDSQEIVHAIKRRSSDVKVWKP